jgi:hypothetical protein
MAKCILMLQKPTLQSLLLRSRALWLTVFTLVFLSWAWWDSEKCATAMYFWPGPKTEAYFFSYDGGFAMGWISDNPFASSGFHMNRGPKGAVFGRITLWPPTYSYFGLILFTSSLCALYLVWRWYLIRRKNLPDR